MTVTEPYTSPDFLPPPARAVDARGAAALAGLVSDDLRSLAAVARGLGAAGAANLLVPHVVLPAVLLDEPGQTGAVTTALGDGEEDFDLGVSTCTLAGARVHGIKRMVSGGLEATRAVIAAGGALAAIELDAPGVTRRPVTTLGRGPDADLELDGVPAEPVDRRRLAYAITVASIVQAAEGAGMLSRLLELSIAQGHERVAFNRPVGSFQAFQHACAEMAMERELADTVVDRAAFTGDERDASRARAFVAGAVVRASRKSVQLHGGAGFLDAHPVARLYRLAKESQLRWGSEHWHLHRVAAWLAER